VNRSQKRKSVAYWEAKRIAELARTTKSAP
jgi:hypothetical protein